MRTAAPLLFAACVVAPSPHGQLLLFVLAAHAGDCGGDRLGWRQSTEALAARVPVLSADEFETALGELADAGLVELTADAILFPAAADELADSIGRVPRRAPAARSRKVAP